MKKDKKFEAVLAKNQIARIVNRSDLSIPEKEAIYEHLNVIEFVIGESNQPSVVSIIASNLNL